MVVAATVIKLLIQPSVFGKEYVIVQVIFHKQCDITCGVQYFIDNYYP